MSHENKLSIIGQVKKSLDDKLAIGQSKHQAKLNGSAQNHIYSWSTYRNYLSKACNFAKWAKSEHGCKTLDAARPYVDEYLENRKDLSAYTQKLDASALAKVYSCSTKDFISTGIRHRADITRSRGKKVRDSHFSEENHREFINFCKGTGLRRREITELHGNQLIERDGGYFIGVTGKGGKYREAPIISDIKNIVSKMSSAGDGRVWDKIPNGADIHSYRSNYATTLYKSLERPLEGLKHEEKYYCRKDLKGTSYDRQAMQKTSEALGHNRISIIAEHYIRSTDE